MYLLPATSTFPENSRKNSVNDLFNAVIDLVATVNKRRSLIASGRLLRSSNAFSPYLQSRFRTCSRPLASNTKWFLAYFGRDIKITLLRATFLCEVGDPHTEIKPMNELSVTHPTIFSFGNLGRWKSAVGSAT